MEPVANIFKTLVASIFFVSILGATQVSAESIQIDLFYDEGTQELRLDRFIEDPVQKVDEVDSKTYDERVFDQDENKIEVFLESFQTSFPYSLKYDLEVGAFQILVPFYSHVREIQVVYPNPETPVLTIDATQFSQCNQNSICEANLGENSNTCLADCDTPAVPIEELGGEPVTDAMSADEETNAPSNSNNLTLIAGIILVIGAGGLGIYKLIQRYR